MRIEARFIGPGLFLILVGAIPLAAREGLLDPADLAPAWRLWPLFLVAAGIGLVLRATPLRELGGILAAALGGVIVGSLLAAGITGGVGSFACSADEGGGMPFATSSGTFAGPGTVALTLDCGSAAIATVADGGWTVAGSSQDGTAPSVVAAADRLAVRSARDAVGIAGPPRWWRLDLTVPETTRSYEVTLNAGALTATPGGGAQDLDATVNAGSFVGDLAAAADLRTIDVTVNAGSASLVLPDASVRGSLTVNAGAIELCTPPGVALRLTTRRGALGGNDFGARGLTETDGVWTTPGWANATHLIELETTANAGGFSLNPEDGCR